MRGGRRSGSRCSDDEGDDAAIGDGARGEAKPRTMLNLGCGVVYKPGFVNVDRYDSSVADVLADMGSLPFGDGAVDGIEADQLLEHFDAAHARVVLSEFHRVLRPGGTLVIETPDIHKAIGRLSSGDDSRQTAEVQWMYGIDSPGLQHKTGFTRRSLRRLLEEVWFEDVRFEKPRTHTYEPGLRAVCRRREPDSPLDRVVTDVLGALSRDGSFGDSFVLVPLQEELVRMRDRSADETELLSRLCVLNSSAAAEALEHLSDDVRQTAGLDSRVKGLAEARFHERAFTLWKKSLRRGSGRQEFEGCVNRLAKDVKAHLLLRGDETDPLRYVLSLDPTPIRAFELRLAMVEGGKATGRGVKMYFMGRWERAAEHFMEAVAINPADFQAQICLARLLANHGGSPSDVREAYSKAMKVIPRRLRAEMEREVSDCEDGQPAPDTPFMPP